MTHDLAALADRIGRDRVAYVDEHVLLLHARWQDVIGELPQVDAVITDPPYLGAAKQMSAQPGFAHGRTIHNRARDPWSGGAIMRYEPLTEEIAADLVYQCTKVCLGWFVAFNDWPGALFLREAIAACGWHVPPQPAVWVKPKCYVLPCGAGDSVQKGAEFLPAGRPRGVTGGQMEKTGVYRCKEVWIHQELITGGKPLDLMTQVVTDYSREGDLILDPCAGGATTLLAARLGGRQCIGVEMDPDTCALAAKRLERDDSHKQQALFKPGSLTGEQAKLFGDGS